MGGTRFNSEIIKIYESALLNTKRDDGIFTPLKGARSEQLATDYLFKRVSVPYLFYNKKDEADEEKGFKVAESDCLYLSQVVKLPLNAEEPDKNIINNNIPDILKTIKEEWFDKGDMDVSINHQLYGTATNWFVQYYVRADMEYALAADQKTKSEMKEPDDAQAVSHEGFAAIKLYQNRLLEFDAIFKSIVKTEEGSPLISLFALAETGDMLQSIDGECNPQKRFDAQMKAIAALGEGGIKYEQCSDIKSHIQWLDFYTFYTFNGVPIDSLGLLQEICGYYQFLEYLGVKRMDGIRRFILGENSDLINEPKKGLYVTCFNPDQDTGGYKALFEKIANPNSYAHALGKEILPNTINVGVCLTIPLPILLYEMACFTEKQYIKNNASNDLKDKIASVKKELEPAWNKALAAAPELKKQVTDAIEREKKRYKESRPPEKPVSSFRK